MRNGTIRRLERFNSSSDSFLQVPGKELNDSFHSGHEVANWLAVTDGLPSLIESVAILMEASNDTFADELLEHRREIENLLSTVSFKTGTMHQAEGLRIEFGKAAQGGVGVRRVRHVVG